ncbi:winged helix-turn-helix transcriptional regulator [Streptomyces clavifer]|uniref:winged helix-turn-helix transcriptional regulator n=1 Tax=Streptomyces clavifer TaxID=68188 RepID=UPI0033B2E013
MSQYARTRMIRGDGERAVRAEPDRICDTWTLLVVATLEQGRLRFTDLQRQTPGISQRMLTPMVRKPERDGLASRTAHAEVPPRGEYALTPTGQSAPTAWAAQPPRGRRGRQGRP